MKDDWKDDVMSETYGPASDANLPRSMTHEAIKAVERAAFENVCDVLSRFADFPFSHQGPAEGPLAVMIKQARDALAAIKEESDAPRSQSPCAGCYGGHGES